MGTNPVFSEVIGISFDVNSFAESIKQLQEMWQNALKEMSGDSPVVGVGNMDGVTAALSKVGEDVKALGTNYSAAIDQVFEKLNVKVTESAKKISVDAKKAAADALSEIADQVERGTDSQAVFNDALNNYLRRGMNPNQLTTRGQQLAHESIADQSVGVDFDKLTAKQREWYVNYEQVLAQAEDRMVEFASKQVEVEEAAWRKIGLLQDQAMKEDAARTAAKQRASEQEEASAQRMGVLQSQAGKEDESRAAAKRRAQEQEEAFQQKLGVLQSQAIKEDEARSAAKVNSLAKEEAAAQRMGVIQSNAMREDEARATAQEQSERRMVALQEAAYKEDQARTEAKLRALQQEEDAIQRVGRMQAAAEAEDKRRSDAQQKAAIKADPVASFKSSFSENFSADNLGNLAGMATIGATIGVAYEAMSKLVGLFKDGFEYAQEMQEATAKLQGVIASNVELSKDFQTNFEMAGEAASSLHQKFQDAAIQYGTSVEILERGFKQLVDGGGVSMVRNLDEAAQLSIKLGIALQAAGKDADTSRAIMSELPKMLEGTEKPSSFILETLGLTVEQWNKLIASAKVHHDLLDQVSSLTENYAKVAENAANRQAALTASIGLEVKRIMADGEGDAFSGWTEALKEVKQFLSDHKVQIEAIVSVIMDAVSGLGSLLGTLLKSLFTTNGLKQEWQLVGATILTVVEGVALLAKTLSVVVSITEKFVNALTSPGNWAHMKDSLKEAVDYAKAQFSELGNTINEAGKHVVTAATGISFATGTDDHTKDNPLGGKTPADTAPKKFNDGPLTLLKQQYELHMKEINDAFELEKQNNAILVAENAKDQKQADADVSTAAVEAHKRQIDLIAEYRAKATALVNGKTGANPKDVATFGGVLDQKAEAADRAEAQRLFQEKLAQVKQQQTEQRQADNDDIAAVKRVTEEHIAAIQKRGSAYHGLTVQMVDEERSYLTQAKQAIDASYDAQIREANQNVELVKKLTAEKVAFDDQWTAKLQANSQERSNAELRAYERTEQARLKAEQDSITASSHHGARDKQDSVVQLYNASQAQVKYAADVKASTERVLEFARAHGVSGDALVALEQRVTDADAKLQEGQNQSSQARQRVIDSSPEGASLTNLGGSLKDAFGDFSQSGKDFTSNFTGAVQNLGEAINVFHDSTNNIMNAFHNGGILGGAGATASTLGGVASSLSKSITGAFGSALGVAGPIGSAIGGLFTAVSSILSQKALETAETITKNLTNINNAYSDQTATLIQTLQAVQAQRQDAINELSGIKGGQDQLDKLLPQMDQEIAQLQLQIKQAKITFENSLQDLQLNNTALSGAFDKWQQINQQVQAYLSAGGSVVVANKYISDSLEQMKTAAGDSLNQGYQQAISDAESLNNLIQQRMQMERQEAETEFNTINGDALERRGTKAIDEGTQLQQEKAQYQQQMDSLNAQVDLTQQKVNLEGQIFNIAMSTSQLQQESNALQIQQLQEQLTILKGQQAIYNGITQGANGQYGMSQTLMNQIGVVNIVVQSGGTAGDDSASSPQDYADAVSGVLNSWARYGLGTNLAKT
jgi:hypothetical protein